MFFLKNLFFINKILYAIGKMVKNFATHIVGSFFVFCNISSRYISVVFTRRSFLRNQTSNCFITEDNLACRALSVPITNIFVSSAYRTNFASWIFNSRSFIYAKNMRDPIIEPCGLPYAITLGED